MNVVNSIKPIYWNARLAYRLTTQSIRLQPDFIILGTQRGGTTSLYFYLTQLPSIFPAMHKEVHFFDDHYAQGMSWYRAQFPTTLQKFSVEHVHKQLFLTGESSPYYLFHPHTPKRVAAALPHVKMIVLLRNPVDRAYSHHWLVTQEGVETLPFEKAIRSEGERLAGEREKMLADEHYASFNHRHYTYLSRGIYVDQLQTWMQFFPREQFLILKSEDLYSDPQRILQETVTFLGLPATSTRTQEKEFKQYREPHPRGYNNNEKPPKMDTDVRKYLVEYFQPHNARLYTFLGRNFGWDQ